MLWTRGTKVLYRYGRNGQARFVKVGTVISDEPAGTALWVAPESPQIECVRPDGRPLRATPLAERANQARIRVRTRWRGPGIVKFVPRVDEWSVWWFWRPDGTFDGWYGNLEARHRRWTVGDGTTAEWAVIDTADRALDVIVEPDRRAYWKDEDEFAATTGQPGRWTADQVPAIRETGERLMALAAAAEFPFDGRWTGFTPDPAWPVPEMPDDWDRPHQAGP